MLVAHCQLRLTVLHYLYRALNLKKVKATMLRTVEAIYENGVLRPLEPIQDRQDQMYLITIITAEAVRTSKHFPASTNLRGKYRGMLSSSEEFAHNKAGEKALER